jgi:hypothetical protein
MELKIAIYNFYSSLSYRNSTAFYILILHLANEVKWSILLLVLLTLVDSISALPHQACHLGVMRVLLFSFSSECFLPAFLIIMIREPC